MSVKLCIQCAAAYGTSDTQRDSHGICGPGCQAANLGWMRGVFACTSPALWLPEGWAISPAMLPEGWTIPQLFGSNAAHVVLR
jgi:hypothetical protein